MYSNIIARLFSMYVSIENRPVSSKTSSETGYSHVPSSKGLICLPLKYRATLIWKLLNFLTVAFVIHHDSEPCVVIPPPPPHTWQPAKRATT